MKAGIFQRALSSQRRFPPFLARVRDDFHVVREVPARFRRHYFDTFDWRLYQADCALEVDELTPPRARLCGIGGKGPLVEEPAGALPVRWGEFREGRLRRELTRLARHRALIRVGGVEVRASPYEIRNRAGKILAHLSREQILDTRRGGRGRTVATLVRLRPLRGYEEVAEDIFDNLEDPGAGRAEEVYRAALRLIGRVPGDYTGRLRVTLSREQTARQALATVLLFLLDIAERNLEGVQADIDTEFLHDFRISCRRSRSLLTQVRDVLPPADLARFRDTFSWLSTATGPQRDLDVFLLDLPEHAADLEPEMRAALAPFRDLLEGERARAHARLLEELGSGRCTAFLRDWREFLVECAAEHAGEGAGMEPVAAAAGKAIARVYRRLLRDGRALGAGGYSEALHELRKTGKKLRYLLEAFRTLYPEKDIEVVIGALRKLQNVLGDIVDSAVQQSYLREWNAALAARGALPEETALALAQLGAAREAAGAAAERKFQARFAAFAGDEIEAHMQRLLGKR